MDTDISECRLCHDEGDCIEGICSNCAASDCISCEYKNGCNFKDCRKWKHSHV
jgi:hypothetical protein